MAHTTLLEISCTGSNKMLVFRAEIHKMFVRIAKREGPEQTTSSELGLHCLSGHFYHRLATSTKIFLTFYRTNYLYPLY